ncbi:MAG: hypothetical protein SFW65_10020 [Alphaproteobacteria bacterium]|nr:hypothetical protein [Alphaproteobacteria bacterium]
MTDSRFKGSEFRAAIEEVVAKHLDGKTHIPSADKLMELAAEGVQAAIDAAIDEGDFKPAKGLEHVPFTEFAKLSVLVPHKYPNRENLGLIDYPLLSENFLAEPIFQRLPTIAAFRAFLEEHKVRSIDDVTFVRIDGVDKRLRYDRRAELIQLIHRTGLDPLPGMVPYMEMGKGSAEWDIQYLRAFMEQATSPQTRDMVKHLIVEGEGDKSYYNYGVPITRNLIMKHLKQGEGDALLDNAIGFRNAGPQVAAHLRFLLDFRRIGMRGGKPYLMPAQPKGRGKRPDMVSVKL